MKYGLDLEVNLPGHMPGNNNFSIIYQDNNLIVVNKPSGLLVIQDGYHHELPNLTSLLESIYGQIWVVHRLDKETSGIVVFARNANTHRWLNQLFRLREIHKTYHSIVNGIPIWSELDIQIPLRVNGDRKHRTVIDYEIGKPAFTRFQVLRNLPQFCYLQAEPVTGYTHQIRAHLLAIGHSILFDRLYMRSHDLPRVSSNSHSLALHAFQLQFLHPQTGKSMSFSAPDPPDFVELLMELR
jgi:RluA family pseudouridine synthase